MTNAASLYLLDANVLIDAARDYYRIKQVPQFWHWLTHVGSEDRVKIPVEIYNEISTGTDEVAAWLRQAEVREALRMDEKHDFEAVQEILENGYGEDLTEVELEKIGKDPYLVSYALNRPERCVVTAETSKPKRQRANRKIADVCRELGVSAIFKWELTRVLDFRTDWDR